MVVRTIGALLVISCATVACGQRVLVALPSTASDWVDDYAARTTTTSGVTVEARTRGFDGAPLELGRLATPVHVRIENAGKVPLRVSRDDFQLVSGTAEFRPLPPDQIGGTPRADLWQRELRPGTLEPGHWREGFVYFEPVIGDWGFIHLRTMLVAASSQALLDSVDVPFSSGRTFKCTLAEADRQEPRSGENILFHGCLPSP
jgi:hypothetical protein